MNKVNKMGAIEKAIGKFNQQNADNAAAVPTAITSSTVTSAPTGRAQLQSRGNGQASNRLPVVPGIPRSNNNFTLPYGAMEEEGMLSVSANRNQLSEEYRAIKRPILAAIDAQSSESAGKINRNIIMMTSCVSGEGKTFSAINLALSIALEKDREVLLVDSDITNPNCSKRLGFVRNELGLTELLLNKEVNPEEYIWQSDLQNFRFLPAGKAQDHVTELLSSRNMSELLHGLSSNYPERVIIFDSAPLLLTSEASIVADLAGQIAFVVSAESTTKGMVSDALRIINDHSRVGFILNKTRKSQNNIYGYGYGYGYGYQNAG